MPGPSISKDAPHLIYHRIIPVSFKVGKYLKLIRKNNNKLSCIKTVYYSAAGSNTSRLLDTEDSAPDTVGSDGLRSAGFRQQRIKHTAVLCLLIHPTSVRRCILPLSIFATSPCGHNTTPSHLIKKPVVLLSCHTHNFPGSHCFPWKSLKPDS